MKTKTICLGIALLCGLICTAQETINDLDAQDYISHAAITDPQEKTAIIKLFRALKYYRIWDDIHALYLPTGGTELSHSLNAKDPRPNDDAYPLIFPKGATHTNSGVSFNGIDQAAMSLYRATSNRLHVMVYQLQPHTQAFVWSGDRTGITDFYSYTWSALYTNGYLGFANQSGLNFQPTEEQTGFFYGQRINHDTTEGYINGNRIASWQIPVSPYYNVDTSQFIWLNKSTQFATFNDTAQYSIVSLGNAMDSDRVEKYYQIVQAFMSELGIQSGDFMNWPLVPDAFTTSITSNYQWHKATENASDTAIDGVHLYSIGDSLYLWGGWNGNWTPFSFNTGYVSGDGGTTWQRIGQAPWNVRHSAAYGTDALGYGYLIGSDMMPDATDSNRREVWRTRTGRRWRLRTEAPWSGSLVLEGLAIKDNDLYVAGGQFGYNITDGLNDTIWKSSDGGISWLPINTNATHLGGILYNNFKYFKARGKFVAFCGGHYDSDHEKRIYSSQVWVSDDCINWTREKDVPFEPRQYSDMVEWDNRLWVFAGDRPYEGGGSSLNLRSLWWMDQEGNWHQQGSVPVPPRHASGLAVDKKNNRLLIACGNMHTDVWYLEKIGENISLDSVIVQKVLIGNDCSFPVPDLTDSIKNNSTAQIVSVSQSPAAGTNVSAVLQQITPVKVTAIDQNGNGISQTFNLIPADTLAPVLSAPDTVSVNLTADCGMIVPDLVPLLSASDNCGKIVLSQIPAAGTIIDSAYNSLKQIAVIATDDYDNSTTKTVVLKAKDTIPPSFNCPAPLTIYLNEQGQAIIPDMTANIANAFDCSGTINFKQAPQTGTLVSATKDSAINIFITATDESGNSSSCTASIIIKDTIPPVIDSIVNVGAIADSNCITVVTVPVPTVKDNCAATLTGTRSDGQALNSAFPAGLTIITWTAKDSSGNVTVASQTVTVLDNQKPILTVPTGLAYCYSPDNFYTLPDVFASDNCGIESISYSVEGATTRNGKGYNASGSFNPGISKISFLATDIHGNTDTASMTVNINPILKAEIPDVFALAAGTEANTVYKGYQPASSLVLAAAVSGGTAPYEFTWSNNLHSQSIVVSDSSFNNTNNSLTVVAQDSKGCVDSANIVVNMVDVSCEVNNVSVCDKRADQTVSLCVPSSAVQELLNHGATLGLCKSLPGNVADSIGIVIIRNPSTDYFKLLISAKNSQEFYIRIFNSMGQLIEQKQISSDYIELNLGRNYMPGIYLAEIISGNQRTVKKLIKTSY